MKGHRRHVFSCVLAALACVAFARVAGAAIKVACIGEHTTHSHAFPAMNRESQPAGMQEYPAMLQTMLGAAYQVRNFGDCCASVTQGYVVDEGHPYVLGSNAGDGPGYKESIAFLPDVVVIGSWGRHDWGLSAAAALKWNIDNFETGYDDLVQRYRALASHPKIFVSLPIPILNGQDGPDRGVYTSAVVTVVKRIAAKYGLPTIDLYAAFFNHRELFKQPPDPEGEGEHVTDAGLRIIAEKVYAALMADADGGGTEAGASDASEAGRDAASEASSDASDSGAGGAAGAAGSTGSAGEAGATVSGTTGTSAATTGSGGAGPATGTGGSAIASAPSSGGCSCRLSRRSAAPSGLFLFALALLRRARRRDD
jgi:hypothetical protein